jgi:hypothetical protein
MPATGYTGNNTGISATGAFQMMGYGTGTVQPWVYTPTVTGQILAFAQGSLSVVGAGESAIVQVMFGTGSAPPHLGGLTGSALFPGAFETDTAPSVLGGSTTAPFDLEGAQQLAVNTKYWFDLSVQGTGAGGAVTVQNPTFNLIELAGAGVTGPTGFNGTLGSTGPTGFAIGAMPDAGFTGWTNSTGPSATGTNIWSMQGYGNKGVGPWKFTPTVTGQLLVTSEFTIVQGVSNAQVQNTQLMYGTGTAPVYGGGLTGTVIPSAYGAVANHNAGQFTPVTLQGVIDAQALGVQLWVDIAMNNTNGGGLGVIAGSPLTFSTPPTSCHIIELAGAAGSLTGPTGATGATGPTGAVFSAGGTGGGATGPTGFMLHGNILINWGVGVNNATFGFARAYTDTGPTVTVTPIGATATVQVKKTSLIGAQVNLNPSGQFYWHAIGT